MTPLSLSQNLVLSAGAGTGKTHALMTLALHLLSGARPGSEPLPPSELCIVTFTEKAAAQLRARLRARVEALCAESVPEALEPELRESFATLAKPFPSPSFWRGVQLQLSSAQIGTFHALALRWLGRLSPRGDAEGGQLLDEDAAGELLREVAERTVLERLDAQDPVVARLCQDLGFSGGEWTEGLVEAVIALLVSLREEGTPPKNVSVLSEPEAHRAFESHLSQLRASVGEARAIELPPRYEPALGAIDDALTRLTLESFERDYPSLERAAREGLHLGAARAEAREKLRAVKHGIIGDRPTRVLGLADHFAGWVNAPLEATLRELTATAATRYAALLRRRGVIDFADLLARVRDAWRDRPAARRAAQARVGALLVDEFQDTNRVQLELVVLLAEQRDGAARAIAPTGEAILELPIEPSFLAIVGDRKQSIYEFRGADVSLFETLAQRIDAAGGRRVFLQRSYRSTPALVEVFNRGFERWMAPGPGARDYEVAFGEGDTLLAARSMPEGAPARIRLLEAPAPREGLPSAAYGSREAEARALAQELRRLVGSPAPGAHRPLRGGEIAVLFRRFTWVEVYRQALLQAGVRHQLWQGRGFFAAPEIRDVEALLAWLCDPEDNTSLAALLRSPFVGVSDGSLFSLAQVCGGPPTRTGLLAGRARLVDALPRDEAVRVERFLALETQWRSRREQMSARDLTQQALEQSGYLTAAAASPHGEQVLANLDKLLDRAARVAGTGEGEVARFAQDLRRWVASPGREAQAELQDGVDPDAVQLLTVHQAKGLEWPVVVVADVGAARFRPSSRVLFDRRLGLALRCPRPGLEGAMSPRFRELSDERARREEAEELRLFYVALTRARDALVLSGVPGARAQRTDPRGWAACVAGLRDFTLADLREDVPWEEPPPPRPSLVPVAPPDPSEVARLAQTVARVRHEPGPSPRVVTLDAWAAASDCARRYWLREVAPSANAKAIGAAHANGGALELGAARVPGRHEPADAEVLRAAFEAWRQSPAAEGYRDAPKDLRRGSVAIRAAAAAPGSSREVQVTASALAAWRGADGAVGMAVATDALSARGLALAHRFLDGVAQTWGDGGGGGGAEGTVQLLAYRRRITVEAHDPDFAALEAERTTDLLHEAHHREPGRLPIPTCRGLGCEFLSRCHPADARGEKIGL